MKNVVQIIDSAYKEFNGLLVIVDGEIKICDTSYLQCHLMVPTHGVVWMNLPSTIKYNIIGAINENEENL